MQSVQDVTRCAWCGCETEGGNHGTSSECVAALQREAEALRKAVEQQRQLQPAPPDAQRDFGIDQRDAKLKLVKPAWKFRSG